MLGLLQRVGRALMMPIAVLPAAALLLRLGEFFGTISWLSWGNPVWNVMETGGGAVFESLPIIFAIGVAIGFSGGAGAAGLAAVVGHIVLVAIVDMDVLGGIIVGLLAAALYRRYKDVDLPDYLAFFGGRRFVPIITAFAAMLIGLVGSFVWPPVEGAIDSFGSWIIGAGALGAFAYGVANRALIPFGLHHIINTFIWFQFGTFRNDSGKVVRGEINRFFAGDPDAGLFLAGFYLIMMFGLPAAAYAMYRQSDAANRRQSGAVMGSSGFTSFLTGITEPIEFSFLFLAPVLFGIHALLTGSALFVAGVLGIKHGFGFSAGLIDYLINYGIATNPLLLVPVGLIYAAVYFVLFTFAIRTFDLPTPGRTPASEQAAEEPAAA